MKREIEAFIARVNQMLSEHHQKKIDQFMSEWTWLDEKNPADAKKLLEIRESYPPAPFVLAGSGRKYRKIIKIGSDGQESIFCFIRLSDGAILRAANWNKPAKHSRGSIFEPDVTKACSVFGAKYMPSVGAGKRFTLDA